MKNIYTLLYASILVLISSFVSLSMRAQGTVHPDSAVMSAGYANEVYYGIESRMVQTFQRGTWDIAFRTMKRSSSILTNDGSGVVLYTYPKADTSGWNSFDTTGFYTWKPMYNDPTNWENGAFSRNAKGHPDYGWCKYNDVTHNLIGDSLFVIKLRDGSLKKIWIIKKLASLDIFVFRYANLDGTGEQNVSEDISGLLSVDFSGYSLQTNSRVVIQPNKNSWDILFTKYMSVQTDGSPYPVVGVLSNDSVRTKNFHPVDLSYNDFGAGKWDSTRSSIGWNWKLFNQGTFTYSIVDSSVYFVKDLSKHVYKLYFTGYGGSQTGFIGFTTQQMTGMGVQNPGEGMTFSVFPNPASGRINIQVTGKTGEDLLISLTDLSGRQLRADRPGLTDGLNAYSMDVTGVQPGIYFVTVSTAATKSVTKVIISR